MTLITITHTIGCAIHVLITAQQKRRIRNLMNQTALSQILSMGLYKRVFRKDCPPGATPNRCDGREKLSRRQHTENPVCRSG